MLKLACFLCISELSLSHVPGICGFLDSDLFSGPSIPGQCFSASSQMTLNFSNQSIPVRTNMNEMPVLTKLSCTTIQKLQLSSRFGSNDRPQEVMKYLLNVGKTGTIYGLRGVRFCMRIKWENCHSEMPPILRDVTNTCFFLPSCLWHDKDRIFALNP